MFRRSCTLAFNLLITVAVAAQQGGNSATVSTPPATAAPETRAAEAPASDTRAIPPAVRGMMAEKSRELTSNDPARVAAAAYSLGELGRTAVSLVPQLAAVLGDNRHVDPARYRKHLVARSTRPESSSPGEEAAAALAKIGDPAIEALISVLKNSPNATARQNAAWALGIIQHRHATGALGAAEFLTAN